MYYTYFIFQLVTLETTLRMYWRDPRLQVEHLLGNSSRDYILLHPDTSKFIWFPDIYIGKFLYHYLLSINIYLGSFKNFFSEIFIPKTYNNSKQNVKNQQTF